MKDIWKKPEIFCKGKTLGQSLDFEFIHKNQCKRAILLFHGMTGSPFEMKKMGRALFEADFDVFCYCLPGHGTSPVNIKTVRWQDWYNDSVDHYKTLAEKYKEVYLGGLCMGGVLALVIAAEHKEVKGIVSLSTTLYLDGWTIPWYNFFMPLGVHTILRYYYSFPEREPYGLKNEVLRKKIAALQKRNTEALDNYPMSCIYELLKLSKFARKNMSKVTAPVLLMHAKQDDLTSTKGSKFVYNNIKSKIKKYIELEDSYHLVVMDNQRDYVFKTSIDFLNSLSDYAPEAEHVKESAGV